MMGLNVPMGRGVPEILTAYSAERAAALAGIPISTLHYWARTELLVPSVSSERVKLWSYEDLLGLRTIDWLRWTKEVAQERSIPRTTMATIRKALRRLRDLELRIWEPEIGPSVLVDREGHVHVARLGQVETIAGQAVLGEMLDLLAPFGEPGGVQGPDLRAPRTHLRIVPGKLAGEPHIERTRVETRAIAALAERGYVSSEIQAMYPFVELPAVEDALDLERQLTENVRLAA